MSGLLMFGRGPSGVGTPEMTDSERRHADAIKFGRIKEVDYKKARARVLIGDETDPNGHLITGWLKFGGQRAAGTVEWNPPVEGEEVVVLSESGEVQNGVVMPLGLYNETNKQNGDKKGLWRKTFPDGAVLEYDHDSGAFKMEGKNGLTLKVGGVTFKMSESGIDITGGKITHDGLDIGSTHKHRDVTPGAGLTGIPVA